MEHRIELIPRANLVARPAYRMSLKEENMVKKVVDKYLNKGFDLSQLFPICFTCITCKEERWFIQNVC